MLNRISKRYAALKSGVPRQELRVRITKSRRNSYIWNFSENLLVLQSSHHPHATMTMIYLDARTEPRRIITGQLALDFSGRTVKKVKVCRNMLVIERISDTSRPGWVCIVDCFRVSLSPGNSEVIATKVSSFDTFRFDYSNPPGWTISDHSGKYYATHCSVSNPGALQIWDIERGEMVRRIPNAEFSNIRNVTNVLVIARKGPGGPQQVVVVGNGQREWGHDCHPCWTQVTPEWDRMSDFKVFPIDVGSPEWAGCVEKKVQPGISQPLTLETPLVCSFKVPRCPAGITSLDTPGAPGYLGEEMGLTLWHWNSDAGDVYSSYHSIIPDHPPTSASDARLVVEREFRIAFRGTPCCSPFNAGFRSGLSITMDALGEKTVFEGIRVISYKIRVRGFYPSATPGVMDLDWETHLKSSEDRRERREILSVNREFLDLSICPLMVVIDESELATIFLDMSEGVTELVLLLWDDGFHWELPSGGEVLN